MTMACLAAITKFTDEPYEIIVVDNAPDPNMPIRDDYHALKPYKYIVNENNENVYHSYNQGALASQYDKLVFIQSDVYCHERTINKLVKYLDEWEMAFPQQVPITREQTQQILATPDGKQTDIGGRDAGMLAITKDAFYRAGGWDEDFHNLLGEKAFFCRCALHSITWTDHTNAIITHIMAGNNLQKTDALYNEEITYDSELFKEKYG